MNWSIAIHGGTGQMTRASMTAVKQAEYGGTAHPIWARIGDMLDAAGEQQVRRLVEALLAREPIGILEQRARRAGVRGPFGLELVGGLDACQQAVAHHPPHDQQHQQHRDADQDPLQHRP